MKKNPLKKINFFLVMILLFLFLAPVSPLSAAATMPHFALKSVTDGKTLDSSELQGKVMLITFFATWCPPCMQEIPSLIDLQKEFGAKGFTVVAISVDQGGTSAVKRVIEKTGINYPVLMADSKVTSDFGGIVGIPTSFLVNQQGNVIKNYPGFVGHTIFAEDIKQLLP
ncbi:MAG: TlpA disulfide reductase family protein [Thermodesulfobacteriota bacterium]